MLLIINRQEICVKAFLEPIEVNGNFVIHFGDTKILLESCFLYLCDNISFCEGREDLYVIAGNCYLMENYHSKVRIFILKYISATQELYFLYPEIRLFEIH